MSWFFRLAFFIFFVIFSSFAFSEIPELKHNSWELVIYRPENSPQINEIRCYLEITGEDGNDVLGTKAKATYEWASVPDVVHFYKKKVYLSGGMAAHLHLAPGKYRFSVFTPESEIVLFSGKAKSEWKSNVFEYDTENPAKVIFVVPESDDNGFYKGSWFIDWKAPKWHKFTKPKM